MMYFSVLDVVNHVCFIILFLSNNSWSFDENILIVIFVMNEIPYLFISIREFGVR